MLNIKLYSGVPFQSNYNNVILFNDKNDLNNYLETYLQGTINNIAQFFDGNNEIVLSDLYENCNYMFINDTNSATPYKYYFIENYEFISGGGVKYKLIMDVWATYIKQFTMKNTLLLQGHCDVFNISSMKSLYRFKSVKNAYNIIEGNSILKPYNQETDYISIIALVMCKNTASNYPASPMILFDYKTPQNTIQSFMTELSKGEFYTGTNDTKYTYNVIKVYIIPHFNFGIYYNNYSGALKTANFYTQQSPGDYEFNFIDGLYIESEENNIITQGYIPFERDSQIGTSTAIFSTTNNNIAIRTTSKIIIGTLGNYKDVEIPLEDNPYMTLDLHVHGLSQLEIYLTFGDNKINLTSNFEIPYFNDEYLQYMNRNQNQIDVSNKTNMLNAFISLGGIGATATLLPLKSAQALSMGIGAISTASGYLSGVASQNAKMEDLKNNVSRLDGTNNNSILMLRYGVGSFLLRYDDYAITQKYNLYGSETQGYINKYIPDDTSLYNFYYIQTSNCNIVGNFNENIKKIIASIFDNGVRIWITKLNFLDQINYKH